jgi:SAM-dependent methyltransferase
MDKLVIDPAKLEAFAMRAVGDLTAGYAGVMVSVGSKLGLYEALAGAGPLSSKELAKRTGCAERFVCEWLNAQAAGGYLDYHALSRTYELSPEHAAVLAEKDSPYYIPPVWDAPAAMWFDESKTLESFRTGKGIAWGEHHERMACGLAAFYRNVYRTNLVSQWLPALDGVAARLQAGCIVADIGCGHGHSTVTMALAFPNSRFHGFDRHAASIEQARAGATMADVAEHVSFDVARADDYPDHRYGLICFFDTLHYLGDPVAAALRAAQTLAPGGTVMLVEPFANDRTEDNLNPVGQLFYSGSCLISCAHAVAEGGKLVLGAQAGPKRLAEVFRKAGFTHFRRAAETPYNSIYEIRR